MNYPKFKRTTTLLGITFISLFLLVIVIGLLKLQKYDPLEHLNSDEVEYFKGVLWESGEFYSENISITISKENVVVHVLDETGKTVSNHFVTGQLEKDMRNFITNKNAYPHHCFEYDIFTDESGNIEGYRVINQDILDKQENGIFKLLEDQILAEDELDNAVFTVSKDNLYYGSYEVLGRARTEAFNILYGISYSFDNNYDIDIDHKKGIIKTE